MDGGGGWWPALCRIVDTGCGFYFTPFLHDDWINSTFASILILRWMVLRGVVPGGHSSGLARSPMVLVMSAPTVASLQKVDCVSPALAGGDIVTSPSWQGRVLSPCSGRGGYCHHKHGLGYRKYHYTPLSELSPVTISPPCAGWVCWCHLGSWLGRCLQDGDHRDQYLLARRPALLNATQRWAGHHRQLSDVTATLGRYDREMTSSSGHWNIIGPGCTWAKGFHLSGLGFC